MSSEALRQAQDIALTLYVPLALGYLLQKLRIIGTAWTRPAMLWLMMLVEPPIIMYSLWILRTGDVAVGQSFFAGVGSIMLAAAMIATVMVFVGRLASQPFHHDARTRGAFIASAVFSNNGFTLGVFVCLLFLGIRGQSIGLVYATYFLPYFVTVGFALGRRYGGTAKLTFRRQLVNIFTQPMSVLPLAGFALGLLLHTVAPPPHSGILPINKIVVHLEVATYAFAIGCTLSLRSVRKYWKECAALCGMKFLVMPVVGLGVVFVLRSFGILGPEPILRKVFLIQTCMPAAIMSVVLARLFHLNEDLASSCWVVTTVASAAVLPVIYLLIA